MNTVPLALRPRRVGLSPDLRDTQKDNQNVSITPSDRLDIIIRMEKSTNLPTDFHYEAADLRQLQDKLHEVVSKKEQIIAPSSETTFSTGNEFPVFPPLSSRDMIVNKYAAAPMTGTMAKIKRQQELGGCTGYTRLGDQRPSNHDTNRLASAIETCKPVLPHNRTTSQSSSEGTILSTHKTGGLSECQSQPRILEQQEQKRCDGVEMRQMMFSQGWSHENSQGIVNNYALAEYETKLLLLEKQNKKRLMMARREQVELHETSKPNTSQAVATDYDFSESSLNSWMVSQGWDQARMDGLRENPGLKNYYMQLILLEQQQKKRLMTHRDPVEVCEFAWND